MILFQMQALAQYYEFSTQNADSVLKWKKEFSANKFVPKGFEYAFYSAISKYPEFKTLSISIKSKKIKTTMACRPNADFIFRLKNKRHYTILVNNDSLNKNKILFNQLDSIASIGILGHELAHIVDYSQKKIIHIIWMAIAYNFTKYKYTLEHKIDSLTITRGLGYPLYQFSDFVLNKSIATEKYKAFKRKIYMQPEEISNQMRKMNEKK